MVFDSAKWQRERAERRREAGLCTRCGRPSGGRGQCPECLQKARGRPPVSRAYARAWAQANRHRTRGYWLKTAYGLSEADYEALLREQGGVCGICGSADGGGRWGRLSIDHDHRTGAVRGVLCIRCNRALSHLVRDDPAITRAAIRYLTRSLEPDAPPPASRSR